MQLTHELQPINTLPSQESSPTEHKLANLPAQPSGWHVRLFEQTSLDSIDQAIDEICTTLQNA